MMIDNQRSRTWLLTIVVLCLIASHAVAEQPSAAKDTRLLLLTQGPDGHPAGSHEYRAGQRILKKLLSTTPNLEVSILEADDLWNDSADPLKAADGVVLCVAEGPKWLQADPRRQEAFARFAERGGGLTALHWAIGSRQKEPIAEFVQWFGACHGGPDRKYKVLETSLHVAAHEHPVTQGLKTFKLRDEYYYQLKRAPDDRGLTSLLEAEIDGDRHMVCWGWNRPDGGRSFGFSGLHFHANWAEPAYQRLVAQGVLWTVNRTPPKADFPASLSEADLKLP